MSRNSKRQGLRGKMRTHELVYTSDTLRKAAEKMDDETRVMARDCFDHYRGELKRISHEPAPNIAYTVHGLIDEHVNHMRATSMHGPDIQCRKGCAACCHLHVGITSHEADLLLMVARDESVVIDWDRAAKQATKTDKTWHDLAREDQRCVFLGDDLACTVYEHRPGACRKYFVKTAPELCDMQKHPGGKVGIVFSAEAEIIHSAAMTEHGAGNMAAMLLLRQKECEQ